MAAQQQKGTDKSQTTPAGKGASAFGSSDPMGTSRTSQQSSSTGVPSGLTGTNMTARRQETGSGLAGQVRNSASEAFGTVKARAAESLEEQKHTLSTGLNNVAENIRRLGDNVADTDRADGVSRFAADYSSTAADKLEQVAHYFDDHDLNAIYHDVENVARNNAAIFIGGAFALGFLAARFLKSSGRTGMERSIGGRTGNGYGEDRLSSSDVRPLSH